jgi:hypothetical protein
MANSRLAQSLLRYRFSGETVGERQLPATALCEVRTAESKGGTDKGAKEIVSTATANKR